MKKILLAMLVVGVAIGFAISAYTAEEVKVKEKTVGDTTTTTEKVEAGNVKATSKTVEKPGVVTQDDKLKAPGVKLEEKTATASTGEQVGRVKMKAGKTKLGIDYAYWKDGSDYIIEYKFTKLDKATAKEMGLPEGKMKDYKTVHKITSTSPYTFGDAEDKIQAFVIEKVKAEINK